jgi:hypothetical protein
VTDPVRGRQPFSMARTLILKYTRTIGF